MMNRQGATVIQSVARALDLLEAAHAHPGGMSLSEAGAAAGLRVTTAHHLLSTLVQRGYLEKTRRPVRYRVGARLEGYARDGLRTAAGAAAESALRELADGQPAGAFVLARPERDQLLAVVRVHAGRPPRVEYPRADVLHPYASATALLFQALWPADRVASHRAQHPFWRFGEPGFGTLARYERRLASVRRAGVARIDAADFGYRLAAAPVRGADGLLEAALGAAVPVGAMDETTWAACVAALRGAAEQASRTNREGTAR